MPVPNPAPDVSVEIDGPLATVEIRRPPHNYFDVRPHPRHRRRLPRPRR